MATFRLELPEVFTGEEGKDFRQWVRRFEVAVDSMPTSSSSTVQKHSLLPSRLSGSAFTVWESLPESEKKDFGKVKTTLSEVFGRTTYLTNFRSCITARVRLPSEPIEVFSAAIATLVREAFPKYDEDAREGESFRRFMAGVDGVLRRKLYEHGVQTFKSAVNTAVRIEQAALLGQPETPQTQVAMTSNATSYNTLAQPQVAEISTNGYGALTKRLDALEEKIDALKLSSHPRSSSPSPTRRYDRSYRPERDSSYHRNDTYHNSSYRPERNRDYYRRRDSYHSPARYHDRSYRYEGTRDQSSHPSSYSSPSRYPHHESSSSPSRYHQPRSSSPARYQSSCKSSSSSPSRYPYEYQSSSRSSYRSPNRSSYRSPNRSSHGSPNRRPPTPPRVNNRVHFDDETRQGNYY